MNRERHQQVERLFDRALGFSDSSARDGYLKEACAGDPELEEEVRRMLKSYDSWTSGLNLPAPAVIRCGPYECEELLGSGGMGSVYRARRVDGQYTQEVAIKFLRGSLRNDLYRARFVTERQILAHLNHPNIARLLDGGMTSEGEPYLVMEYVEGEALDLYCDRHKLTIDARIALFQQVLDAVDSAHRNLVVHRDLKPSNILVTREGLVKLLDFGTSKLLAEDATVTEAAILTPAYASPEQLRGEPVATTSDVFSLGVALFRLLTGSDPFGDSKSYAGSLERALRETTPSRPETLIDHKAAEARSSTLADLQKRLRGDLASILQKALAHDAAERYPSVASFAEDLHRYRDQRPVLARRQTWAYLTGRALRRHIRGVAVAALLVIALAAAAIFSARQARLAQHEANRAQAANRFLTDLFEIPVRDSATRHDLTVRELLELAEKRVTPALGADAAVAADVDYVLAAGLHWQGAAEQARTLLNRALERSRKANDIPRQALVMALLGSISFESNQPDQAWKEALDALDLWKGHQKDFTSTQAVGVLHDAATTLLYIRPSDPGHRKYFEQALALARRYPNDVPSSSLSACLQKLGESYINVDRRYQDAYPLLKEAVAINRSNPARGDLLFSSLQSFGRVNRFLGRYDDDERAQWEAYQQSMRMNGPKHPGTISQHSIWAQSLLGAGRIQEAYDQSQQALTDMRVLTPARGSPLLWTNLSIASNAACLSQRFAECETLVREAIETLGPNPNTNDLRLADARANLGLSLSGQGRHAEALPLIQHALRLNESLKRRPLYTAALEAALRNSSQ